MKSRIPLVLRYVCCIAIVLLIALVCVRIIPVNATTAALTFLLAILCVATLWGLAESIITSLAAFLALNFFFLPPVGTFTIEHPENLVALLTFLIVAITASQLSARARRRTIEALRRRREIEQLFALGRSILLAENPNDMLPALVNEVSRIFEVEDVAVLDATTEKTHGRAPEGAGSQLIEVARTGAAFHDASRHLSIAPLRAAGLPLGSLAIRGETGATLTMVEAIANLIAIGLERARATERAALAEAARRHDQLRAALLDGLAHDLKTPLTAIKASVTSLLSGVPRTEQRKSELLTIANEETDRLHHIIGATIQMARIEAGKLGVDRRPHAVSEIVAAAIDGLKVSESRIALRIPERMPVLLADADLMSQALRQLIDNADRYSPPHTAIVVTARVDGDSIVLSVADSGPGVPEEEQSRIFEKFYRGRHGALFSKGTGMGLSIAKSIVEAHDGRISFESRPGGGSVFSLQIPMSLETSAA